MCSDSPPEATSRMPVRHECSDPAAAVAPGVLGAPACRARALTSAGAPAARAAFGARPLSAARISGAVGLAVGSGDRQRWRIALTSRVACRRGHHAQQRRRLDGIGASPRGILGLILLPVRMHADQQLVQDQPAREDVGRQHGNGAARHVLDRAIVVCSDVALVAMPGSLAIGQQRKIRVDQLELIAGVRAKDP